MLIIIHLLAKRIRRQYYYFFLSFFIVPDIFLFAVKEIGQYGVPGYVSGVVILTTLALWCVISIGGVCVISNQNPYSNVMYFRIGLKHKYSIW